MSSKLKTGLTEEVRSQLAENDPELVLADGYEEAFIGVGRRCGCPALAVYDRAKCIEILIQRDGMSPEEAEEYFSFNTEGAYVGEGTPIYLESVDGDRG